MTPRDPACNCTNRTASIDAHLFRTHCPVHSGSGLGQVVTPKGVADVLSEADAFLARIARLREENSHPVALYVDASEADQVVRALALHCAEQETECDAMEQFAKLNKERARKAEARCVELEALLVGISYSRCPCCGAEPINKEEHNKACPIAATLTPTVAACPECGVERTDYEGEGKHLDMCPNCTSHRAPVLVEPLSEGVPEPASSASGGQARDDEVTVSKPAYGRALLLLDGVPRSDLSSNQEYAPPGTAAWVAKAVEVLTKLTSRGAPTEEEEQG